MPSDMLQFVRHAQNYPAKRAPETRAHDFAEIASSFGQPAGKEQADGQLLVVAPGTNLWRIARATYGRGAAYTIIYQANREQIEDPDRIYPGQVFRMPGSSAEKARE